MRAERAALAPTFVDDVFAEIGLLVLEGDAAALAAKVAEFEPSRVPDSEAPAGGLETTI